MTRRLLVSGGMTAVLLLAGCAPGFIYTDVTSPLTVDMHRTPRASLRGYRYRTQLREPFSRFGLRAEWASCAIGETAKATGLDTVRYADLRRQSILGGLWERTTIYVYGEKKVGFVQTSSGPEPQ